MADEKSLFDFSDYKAFLRFKVGEKSARRGQKAALAEAAGCQATYISQVLNGPAQLSPEQALAVNEHFGHSKEEAHFFLLLLQRDRAGTTKLKQYYTEQIQEVLDRRLILSKRHGGQNKLSEEHRALFYSSWHYLAIYVALAIPGAQTKEALRSFFQLPMKKIAEVVEFLVESGLARQEGEHFIAEPGWIRLESGSPLMLKHHSNWRTQALLALDRDELLNLHYSAVMSLSRSDIRELKNRMLDHIKDYVATARESKEEEVYALTMDFFSLRK